MMKRRDFLLGLGSASLAACAPAPPPRELTALNNADVTVRTQIRSNPLQPGFVGLSFESRLLADPDWFHGGNQTLQALLGNLTRSGILRIGGNSGDTALWQREPAPVAAPYTHAITPADIDRLADFTQACGWRVVYALNLAHGQPQRAADEAAYVAGRLGRHLDAFVIGNEPDLYERHGLRPSGYDSDAFIAEWQDYAQAIRARAGAVPLAGPEVAYRQDWVEAFARRCASQVVFLSEHYYPVGPASDRNVDINALLRSEAQRGEQMRAPMETAVRYFRPARITEANSCFGGGKPGLSDTEAAALWAIDVSMGFCRDGWNGLYFHTAPQAAYSPIVREAGGAFVAQPLYYGLLLLAQATPMTLVEATTRERPAFLRLFAGVTESGHIRVLLVNPDQANSADVRVDANRPLQHGSVLRLHSPTLFSRHELQLGGAAVQPDGRWKPLTTEAAIVDRNAAFVTVSAAGAVLLTLD
jgi:hypothetical protein